MANEYTSLKEENGKLERIIAELTKSIKTNHEELAGLSDKANEKLEEK
jgi:hypothetical protein